MISAVPGSSAGSRRPVSRFKVWHGECQTEAEAEIYEGDDEIDVGDQILFVYYAGDCDSGADQVDPVEGHPERYVATRKGSPDYYYIQKEAYGSK